VTASRKKPANRPLFWGQVPACRVVTNAVGKPVARCKHQTATLGSNPMLSDNQSFSTLAIMENTPKMGRFRTQTTTRERHGKAERGRFIRLFSRP
jgi:hypothetical protein